LGFRTTQSITAIPANTTISQPVILNPTITGNTTIAGSILPSANTTYDLGSPSLRWSNIYGSTLNLSGGQIAFPATQNASGDANTLDDYEEGTWTPVATSSTGSITSYASAGRYTKIGRTVFVQGRISLTNVGTAGGRLMNSGLPFTSSQPAGRPAVFLVRENAATGIMYGGWVGGGDTTFDIATLTFTAITWTNNYDYTFSFTYEV
jgi:hypothetical protein